MDARVGQRSHARAGSAGEWGVQQGEHPGTKGWPSEPGPSPAFCLRHPGQSGEPQIPEEPRPSKERADAQGPNGVTGGPRAALPPRATSPAWGGFHSPPCPEGRRNRCKADGESRQGNPLHLESRVTGDHRGEVAVSDSQASAHPTKRAARGHRAALPESEGRAACTGTSQGSQQRRPQSLGLQPQHQRCALPRAEGTRGQAGPAQPSEAALHGAKPRHWEPPKGTWGCKGANGDGG